ncbi:MAG TPA: hypothetical protein VHL09_04750, partial [Dehalococcoidia bacterium]|nr:hypothetical protein [Dehalococcoidia bacterium]
MEQRGQHFQDVRELAGFIAGFWGAIAALSVGLALLNDPIGFIPRHPTLQSIATAVAAVAAVFAFLYAYVEGEEEGAFVEDPTGFRRRAPTPTVPTLRSAFGRFAWAVLALALYLTLLALYTSVRESRDLAPGLIAGVLVPILLVTYAAIFGFLTAALGSLAVVHRISALRNRARPVPFPRSDEETLPDIVLTPADEETARGVISHQSSA